MPELVRFQTNVIVIWDHTMISFGLLVLFTIFVVQCGHIQLTLDTVQNFLIKLGIKAHMHLWEISIFSINNVIVRPTKIMNRADKNWTHF